MILLPVERLIENIKIRPNHEEFVIVAKPHHVFPNITLRLARPNAKDLSTDVTLTLPIGALVEILI